jgi:TonB family protein
LSIKAKDKKPRQRYLCDPRNHGDDRKQFGGDISLQEKTPDKQYSATFKLNYYAESPARDQWSEGQFEIDLDISIIDGAPKITRIKEKILRQQKGNLKAAVLRSGSLLVFAPQPWYPEEARRNRLTGSGQFRIHFDGQGRVATVDTVRTTGQRLLDNAAIITLKRWRATPGTPHTLVVPITFTKPSITPSPKTTPSLPTDMHPPDRFDGRRPQ